MEGLRRIVTGHNADGKSIVIIDEPPVRQITDIAVEVQVKISISVV